MAEQYATDDTNLATRAFALLRKLSKEGKLTSEETHELLEIFRTMASANTIDQMKSINAQLGAKLDALRASTEVRLDAQNLKIDSQNLKIDSQNSKIDAQSSKFAWLLWAIGIGTGLIVASNFIS